MSEKFVIRGGTPLRGTVTVGGAKNAAVAILPATILAQGLCTIENLPEIDDVLLLLDILEQMGARIERLGGGCVKIDTTDINCSQALFGEVKRLRASYYLVGALLGRFNKAQVALPGGCAIGRRPIDLHEKGMRALGAHVQTEYGRITATAEALKGADVYLDQVSVGATINVMLAAARASGTTVITNAAKEPHVVDVANFLNCMGARVTGAGTDIIKIRGVQKLHGCFYSVIPDPIEAGTLLFAAAATRGDVIVQNVIPVHMDAVTAKLVEMGAEVEEGYDTIRVCMKNRPRAVDIKTLPYPGFPTDLQQPATVVLATAQGTSYITENIFESRFKHIAEIRRMGAKVRIENRMAAVEGVEKLTGAPVKATDLRAGAALVVAGLMADGETEIYNIKYIDRGYDHLQEKLISLGADIQRVPVSAEEAMDLEYL